MKSIGATITIEVHDERRTAPELEGEFSQLQRLVRDSLEGEGPIRFDLHLKGCALIAATNHNDPPKRGELGFRHRLSIDVVALEADIEEKS
jgi:hypothetical protein